MMHFLLSLMPELGVLYNSCYFLFQSCCFVNFTKIVYLKNRLWACLCVPVIVPPFSLCQTFCFVLFCSGTTSCCAQGLLQFESSGITSRGLGGPYEVLGDDEPEYIMCYWSPTKVFLYKVPSASLCDPVSKNSREESCGVRVLFFLLGNWKFL